MNKFIYRYEAMNTPCELILFHHSKSQADNVANTILLETKRLEKKYNYYDSNSFLNQLNTRKIQELDNETKTILQRTKRYYKLTNKIFDITIATIKELYNSNSNEHQLKEQIQLLRPYIGCEHFTIQRNKLKFDNNYTKIDLGGFVKEYAVDRAVTILQKYKIFSGIINYGGDIYALGRKPNGSKFTIAIKDPINRDNFITEVSLENEALTTSASYERNYKIGSKIFSHIIQKDEYPNTPNSVTVISPNCVESGIFSTSLMVDRNLYTKHKTIIV